LQYAPPNQPDKQTQDGPQWTLSVYAEWTEVVDAFAGYDNILAFGIGQETITDTGTSPFPFLLHCKTHHLLTHTS
jgi:hypothetical protein